MVPMPPPITIWSLPHQRPTPPRQQVILRFQPMQFLPYLITVPVAVETHSLLEAAALRLKELYGQLPPLLRYQTALLPMEPEQQTTQAV